MGQQANKKTFILISPPPADLNRPAADCFLLRKFYKGTNILKLSLDIYFEQSKSDAYEPVYIEGNGFP
jgi:hypothetical protein